MSLSIEMSPRTSPYVLQPSPPLSQETELAEISPASKVRRISSPDAEMADRMYLRGLQLYSAQQYQRAINLLMAVEGDLCPREQNLAIYFSGLCLFHCKQFSKAADFLRKAQEEPFLDRFQRARATYIEGVSRFYQKDLGAACRMLEISEKDVYLDESQRDQAKYFLAIHCYNCNTKEATTKLEEVSKSGYLSEDQKMVLRYCLGGLYVRAGHYQKAIDVLKPIQTDPRLKEDRRRQVAHYLEISRSKLG